MFKSMTRKNTRGLLVMLVLLGVALPSPCVEARTGAATAQKISIFEDSDNSCVDTVGKFPVGVKADGSVKRKDCDWVGKDKTTERCSDPYVASNCPIKCDACKCKDNLGKFKFNEKQKNCRWAAAKSTEKRCRKGIVKRKCPLTCGHCTTSAHKAFETLDEIKTAAKKYCSDPSAWDASNPYGPIETWNLSKLTQLDEVFKSKPKDKECNPPVQKWDVSNIESFLGMFSGAKRFNQDLSDWDVSSATSFSSMFSYATSFNQDLSAWDVSSAKKFVYMFDGATSFNQDLSDWDVSSATSFGFMFYKATSFNQDLSDWDVSRATDFRSMFSGARSFNQDLCTWGSIWLYYQAYPGIIDFMCHNVGSCGEWPTCPSQ